jgi:hypothetical protein
MLVTSDVFHPGMSTLHAAPQSAPPVEQHFSPEGTAAKHLPTATFRAAELRNAEATPPMHALYIPGVVTHAPGGPSNKPLDLAYVPVHTLLSELSKPQLVYVLSHCGARVNISDTSTPWSSPKVQPVMLRLKERASSNMLTMDVTDLTFQFCMLPLKV